MRPSCWQREREQKSEMGLGRKEKSKEVLVDVRWLGRTWGGYGWVGMLRGCMLCACSTAKQELVAVHLCVLAAPITAAFSPDIN